jgi:hypothetical protein
MSEEKDRKYVVTPAGQVTNSAGRLVTQNPMPGRGRPWIKFHVNQWLDGTTRYQTTSAQRAFWVDLLAESGRGRFPGYVAAGQDAGQIVGYPLRWYEAKQTEQFDIMGTLELFERTNKIRIIRTPENPSLIAIEILNWNLYQSDLDAGAQRARKYRGKKKAEKEK